MSIINENIRQKNQKSFYKPLQMKEMEEMKNYLEQLLLEYF